MTRDIHVHAKVMVFAGLFMLFLLSLLFRTYRLNEYPVGFHNDEVYVAYNSWSLLETGKDAYGHLLPLVINQWGDFRPAGYHYLAAASFAIFGISDWATRLPGAVFGAISVLFVWLLVARIWGKSMAWISTVILAILPWHIIICRATSESVVSLAYVLIGAYCFLSAGKKRGLWRYILACILFVLGMWTYHAARYALPVFFLGSAVLTWNKDTRQLANVCMVFFVALSTVAVYLFVSGGQARTSQVSIFSFPEARLVLDESIREDGSQNVLFTRLFHNKLETYADTAIHTALRHLQSDFLVGGVFYPDRYRAGNTTLVP